ncbi:hypothetical protein, partial [Streptococcus suis]|uniref:hypothetical protein n=2 Tax=Streptococcus suis TaxID=1307 RepID=UPI0037039893
PTPIYSKTRKKMTLRKSDNYSKTFWTNSGQDTKKARFNGLFKVVLIHPEGIFGGLAENNSDKKYHKLAFFIIQFLFFSNIF